MKNKLIVGLVVADDNEYADYEAIVENLAKEKTFFGRKAHSYSIINGEKEIVVESILCGIGTVNATAATMHLVNNNADVILNYGLSGGISGVSRGEDIIGSSFIEYDFDLRSCGYKPCEKPDQQYIYSSDEILTNMLSKLGGGLKIGNFASGDRFVSDSNLREQLKNEFNINACDMETAAIAYVANLTKTPFASLRRVSDDAGEDAKNDYRAMNNNPVSDLPKIILKLVDSLFDIEKFWM